MKSGPPKSALRFLRWFCREDYLEEIEGDLTELHEKRFEQSPARAKWIFTWSVIRYFRPGFIKSFKTNYPATMFRHNFLFAYRTFKRYKSAFFINLIGLTAGMACTLLIYLWVSDELSVDKFHEKGDRLFQVLVRSQRSSGIVVLQNTPGPLAEGLIEEMPEVEHAVTSFFSMPFMLSFEDKSLKASGQYASKDFFNVFSYNLIQGDKNSVLSDKNAIVISETLASKLFDTTQDVVGKTIKFQNQRQLQISGVFESVPASSSEQFEFVVSFKIFEEEAPWVSEWDGLGPRTFATLKEGANSALFNEKIAGLITSKTKDENLTLFIVPYFKKYLYNHYENGEQAGGRIEYVRLFSVIAIFILMIACINFMNLSTAKSSRRFKEVGVRKTIGAGRRSLMFQYLGESLSMAFLSLITAISVVLIFLPRFNNITGKQLTLTLDLNFLLSALAITIFTGFMAGSYPALYLSGFSPIGILKGKTKASFAEVLVRRGLVIFQFTLSIILIVGVMVVYKQIAFTQTKNLGYNKDNIIYFSRVSENLETFLNGLNALPGIVSASSISHSMLGWWSSTPAVHWDGKDPEEVISFENMPLNYGAIETLGIEMKEGRTFSKDFVTDSTKIIFNETAVKVMGFENDAIGKTVKIGGRQMEIIGVTRDFHFTSLHWDIIPMYMILDTEYTWNIMARIEAGREQEAMKNLQQFYQEHNPGFPFDYQFLDEGYKALYAAEQRISSLSKYFAAIAILISCLGLFGLAAFTAERRVKEIGIRKIAGCSQLGIIQLLSADFTNMVAIAIVIALPISYFVARQWLSGFAFNTDLKWWFFFAAGLTALVIAWLTVGLQTVKAARINPVECLKDE